MVTMATAYGVGVDGDVGDDRRGSVERVGNRLQSRCIPRYTSPASLRLCRPKTAHSIEAL